MLIMHECNVVGIQMRYFTRIVSTSDRNSTWCVTRM